MLTRHGARPRLEMQLPSSAYTPLGFAAGDTNLYRYVGDDPVNATDPSGLDERLEPKLGPGGLGGRKPFSLDDPTTYTKAGEPDRNVIWNAVGPKGRLMGIAGPADVDFGAPSMTMEMDLDASLTEYSKLANLMVADGGEKTTLLSKTRIGVAEVLPDKYQDKCEAGGERVWVSFMYIARDKGDLFRKSLKPELPLKKWVWDFNPWGGSTTATRFSDYPGYTPVKGVDVDVEFTQLIGVACRSKKDPNRYRKELLFAGTLYVTLDSDGVSRTHVSVEDNKQSGSADVQGDLLNNGKWIDVMNAAAPPGKKAVADEGKW